VTVEGVLRWPRSIHERVVKMLTEDDRANGTGGAFEVKEGYRDR
jgi:hypothetical protein